MSGQERRHGHRFIMRIPLRFHAKKEAVLREESVSSMNISTHGVYFATDEEVREALLVQLRLKMPKEIVGDQVQEWVSRAAWRTWNPSTGRTGNPA